MSILDRLEAEMRDQLAPPAKVRDTRSVTERLAARLDAIEPVVGRLAQNKAKLIADSLSLTRQQGATFNSLAEFCGRSFLQRLRWLLTGR